MSAPVWDTELATQRAREAYRYVARTLPKDAPLGPIGCADRAVLEAEERRDRPAYEEALRELCRVARREAIRVQLSRGGGVKDARPRTRRAGLVNAGEGSETA